MWNFAVPELLVIFHANSDRCLASAKWNLTRCGLSIEPSRRRGNVQYRAPHKISYDLWVLSVCLFKVRNYPGYRSSADQLADTTRSACCRIVKHGCVRLKNRGADERTSFASARQEQRTKKRTRHKPTAIV